MAVRCFPHVSISGGNLTKNPGTKALMIHNSSLPANRTSTALIRSYTLNKVFEDQSRGIICYRDDGGELICEGYDEGPRFCQPASKKMYHKGLPAYFQILDFLEATRLLEDVTDKGAT